MNFKLELAVIPAADVHRHKNFYERLGWRLYADFSANDAFRDIVAARADIAGRGVDISEVFHDAGGVFHHAGTKDRVSGPDPARTDYSSFATFSDPDGNTWFLQEINVRLPGR